MSSRIIVDLTVLRIKALQQSMYSLKICILESKSPYGKLYTINVTIFSTLKRRPLT